MNKADKMHLKLIVVLIRNLIVPNDDQSLESLRETLLKEQVDKAWTILKRNGIYPPEENDERIRKCVSGDW